MLLNMTDRSSKRRYHSPQRQEQAQLTRRKIIEAARRLFASRGYPATTLAAIAAEAGVSMPTVTAVFGTKPALLEALIALVVRGDESSIPVAEQDWWQEMLAEPDPQLQLRLYAAIARRIQERSSDVFQIMQSAATADPDIAARLQQLHAGRLQDTRMVSESLARKGALAPGMTPDEATDLLWALCSAQMFRLLVVERGWPPDRYQAWLTSSLIQSVLDQGKGD